MSDKPKVEILRSTYDGKTLAVSVADLRHGPDAGPWEVIGSWDLEQERVLNDLPLDKECLQEWEAYWEGWDDVEAGIDLPDGTEFHGFIPADMRKIAHQILVLAAKGKLR